VKDKPALRRLNVMLEKDTWLDEQASRAAFDRSKVLRALVAALRGSGMDLPRFESEEQLAVVCMLGLRSAAVQFPQYTPVKDKPGSVGRECVK